MRSTAASGSRIESVARHGAVKVALLDGSSSVLPFDFHLAEALAAQGVEVAFFGSRTRYNGELVDALRALPGASVDARAISGTVASRWRGALAYLGLLVALWRQRAGFTAVNLQFSVLWPLEWPFLYLLRRKLVFTVHNAVPHDFAGEVHAPTRRIAELARTLVFPSRFSHDDFLRRYGERFRARSVVVGHGATPAFAGAPRVRYVPLHKPEAIVFWSTVKPYKGVELFAELARSPRIRALGLPLEVVGAWAPELHGLRDELVGLGVTVRSGFLGAAELAALLARPVVFLLPNRSATQSGALYTLLHHGRFFICADVGDLGDFMRRFGLGRLLLEERSAVAVADALDALREHSVELGHAFQAAQAASSWAEVTAGLVAIYAGHAPAGGTPAGATIAALRPGAAPRAAPATEPAGDEPR